MIMLRGSIVCLALTGLLLAAGSQSAGAAAKTCTTLSAWAVGLGEAGATSSAATLLKWKINNWAHSQKATSVYTGKTETSCQKGPLPRCTSTVKVCV